MKKTQRCPKCGHHRILYISQVADEGYGKGATKAMSIARVPAAGLIGGMWVGAGALEAGVCRACGYAEYYVKNPNSIPVDGQVVREVVGPEQ